MDVTGKMHRAFGVNRIPSGRIGRAEILNLQTDFCDGLFRRQILDPGCRFPGRAARRAAHNLDFRYPVGRQPDFKFGRAKLFSILSQTILPGQTASRRRRKDAAALNLFTGGDQRDILPAAQGGQVMGQIRMFQKIEHQIGLNGFRQVFAAIVDKRRQHLVDIDLFDLIAVVSVPQNTFNFTFTAMVLLKYEYALGIFHRSVSPFARGPLVR